jgi:hypothetical protein
LRKPLARPATRSRARPLVTGVFAVPTSRTTDLQALPRSPLTDSNRRPPPYHGSLGAVRAYTGGHSGARLSCTSAVRDCWQCPRVAARALAHVPVSYPWCVVCFQNGGRLGAQTEVRSWASRVPRRTRCEMRASSTSSRSLALRHESTTFPRRLSRPETPVIGRRTCPRATGGGARRIAVLPPERVTPSVRHAREADWRSLFADQLVQPRCRSVSRAEMVTAASRSRASARARAPADEASAAPRADRPSGHPRARRDRAGPGGLRSAATPCSCRARRRPHESSGR